MCGRFVGFSDLERLKRVFPIDRANCDTVANFNVAPSQEILAIANVDGLNTLDKYTWGLVPFWAKDKNIGNRMINARSETVAEKPAFREAFKKRRCLVPADGFYEWTGRKGSKQPVYITLPEKEPFAFAGLWESWQDRQARDVLRSCTIITREAAGTIKKVHHRMPVILHPDGFTSWLDSENGDTGELMRLLREQCITELTFHPVGKQVNSVKNNDPANVRPVQAELDF